MPRSPLSYERAARPSCSQRLGTLSSFSDRILESASPEQWARMGRSRARVVPSWVLKDGQSACPLWVKSGHVHCKRACPLYPRKRTWAVPSPMSALGQKRTSGVLGRQLFNHLVGAGDKSRWNFEAERLGGL